ncbi:MAG: hypothetical protein WC703_01990 [Candidatus Neomarinimicrobiota bacterium]
MKRTLVFVTLFLVLVGQVFAQTEKGGVKPCLATCLVGPRVGLEMNEGKKIETIEMVACFVPILRAVPGYEKAGVTGAVISFFLGTRVGAQYKERNVRMMEWLQLVPCVNIYPGIMQPLEAFQGKTMTEVEQKEGLRK